MSLLVPDRRPVRELLDDPSLPDSEMRLSLADLDFVHRHWGASRALARYLAPRLGGAGPAGLHPGRGRGRRLRRATAPGSPRGRRRRSPRDRARRPVETPRLGATLPGTRTPCRSSPPTSSAFPSPIAPSTSPSRRSSFTTSPPTRTARSSPSCCASPGSDSPCSTCAGIACRSPSPPWRAARSSGAGSRCSTASPPCGRPTPRPRRRRSRGVSRRPARALRVRPYGLLVTADA